MESLFQTFERHLGELGIQIEFDDGQIEDDVHRDDTSSSRSAFYSEREVEVHRKRERRASFHTINDTQGEIAGPPHERIQPRAQSHEPIRNDRGNERYSSVNGFRPRSAQDTSSTHFSQPRPAWSPRFAPGSPISYGTREPSSQDKRPRDEVDLSLPKQASRGLDTTMEAQIASSPDHLLLSSAIATEEPLEHRLSETHPNNIPALAYLYKPNRSKMLRDADTFQFYRIRSIARDFVERWCDAALASQNHHEHVRRMAVAYDMEVLMRQAFEHWRARLHLRKQNAKIDRFFGRLEKRATRARNLFLLTKAFTHWTQSTVDEHRQRSLIRQQVIGIKYFHAWRDITLAHQSKIGEQSVRASLSLWKRHFVTHLTGSHKADLQRRQSLLSDGYWRWFWVFCERRAPEWHDRKLKHRHLLAWVIKWEQISQRSSSVASAYETRIQRLMLQKLAVTYRSRLRLGHHALAIYQHRIMFSANKAWLRECQFSPLHTQISNVVDWRVAGATFAMFVSRFRCESQSAKLSRTRILRLYWSKWNDLLRCQTLQHRLSDRFGLEALYKWVLMERFLLMRRISERRLRSWSFEKLKACKYIANRHYSSTAQKLQQQADRAVERHALTKWSSELRRQDRAERLAFEFQSPKLAFDAIENWKSALQYHSKIAEWVSHASYYWLGRRYVKLWTNAVVESRRQKRRNAYVHVKRRAKTRLVSQYFRQWQVALSSVLQMDGKALTVDQQRSLRVGTNLFDTWTDALTLLRAKESDGEGFHENHLLEHGFQSWSDQLNNLWEREEMAVANTELQLQKTSFVCFRRLHLRVLEARSQRGKADGLKIGYEKRHFHRLLRLWRENTAKRRHQSRSMDHFSPTLHQNNEHQDPGAADTPKAVEDWNEREVQTDDPEIALPRELQPLPGYLSTPSRRAVRAKAIVQSTTPLGTPFQSRLRAQLNATPRSAKGSIFGKSRNDRNRIIGSKMKDRPEVESHPPLEENE